MQATASTSTTATASKQPQQIPTKSTQKKNVQNPKKTGTTPQQQTAAKASTSKPTPEQRDLEAAKAAKKAMAATGLVIVSSDEEREATPPPILSDSESPRSTRAYRDDLFRSFPHTKIRANSEIPATEKYSSWYKENTL
jgi:hypothetical protein